MEIQKCEIPRKLVLSPQKNENDRYSIPGVGVLIFLCALFGVGILFNVAKMHNLISLILMITAGIGLLFYFFYTYTATPLAISLDADGKQGVLHIDILKGKKTIPYKFSFDKIKKLSLLHCKECIKENTLVIKKIEKEDDECELLLSIHFENESFEIEEVRMKIWIYPLNSKQDHEIIAFGKQLADICRMEIGNIERQDPDTLEFVFFKKNPGQLKNSIVLQQFQDIPDPASEQEQKVIADQWNPEIQRITKTVVAYEPNKNLVIEQKESFLKHLIALGCFSLLVFFIILIGQKPRQDLWSTFIFLESIVVTIWFVYCTINFLLGKYKSVRWYFDFPKKLLEIDKGNDIETISLENIETINLIIRKITGRNINYDCCIVVDLPGKSKFKFAQTKLESNKKDAYAQGLIVANAFCEPLGLKLKIIDDE